MDAILAVDVGTTLSKLQCFRADGQAVGPMLSTGTPVQPDGTADALGFVRAVESILDGLCAAVPEDPTGKQVAIRGCALTCSWHGLAGLDASGEPCTRVSTWMDASAGEEALELRRLVAHEGAVHDRTGCRLHPSYIPARLLRLQRREPDTWKRVSTWVSIGELLQTRWCGPGSPASLSMASGSGLFDSRLGLWDPELCGLLEIAPPTLPRVSDEWRRLAPAYRRRWPALADALWTPAFGDGACSIVGSGASVCEVAGGIGRGILPAGLAASGGAAALSLGTSAAVRLLVESERRLAQPLRPALFAYLLDEARAVIGVSRSNALNLVRWAERTLRLPSAPGGEDVVSYLVRERMPGSSGLEASSALAGERSPDWPANGRGGVAGLSLASEPLDIVQALVEAAVVGLVQAVHELEIWTGPLDLVLSGGGARSPGWQHLMADGFGRPIAVSDAADTSLIGAALLCLQRLGLLEGADECRPTLHVVEPDPVRAEAFARLVERAAPWASDRYILDA